MDNNIVPQEKVGLVPKYQFVGLVFFKVFLCVHLNQRASDVKELAFLIGILWNCASGVFLDLPVYRHLIASWSLFKRFHIVLGNLIIQPQ